MLTPGEGSLCPGHLLCVVQTELQSQVKELIYAEMMDCAGKDKWANDE